MGHTMQCIRFGEILVDEATLEVSLCCNNCYSSYSDLSHFRTHLERCHKQFFEKNTGLKFRTSKATCIIGRHYKENKAVEMKKFLIYNVSDVQCYPKPAPPVQSRKQKQKVPTEESIIMDAEEIIDLIGIEDELMNPIWYTTTDDKDSIGIVEKNDKILEYEKIVSDVSPFVQFKENVNNTSSVKKRRLDFKEKGRLPVKMTEIAKFKKPTTLTSPLPKRNDKTISCQPPQETHLKRPVERICETKLSSDPSPKRPSDPSPKRQTYCSPKRQPQQEEQPKVKETENILNKLHKLGVKIKRTNPPSTPPPLAPLTSSVKAMEIIEKLKSNGTRVRKISKRE